MLAAMAVPKAAMDENHRAVFRQNDVRFARQVPAVETVTETCLVQCAPRWCFGGSRCWFATGAGAWQEGEAGGEGVFKRLQECESLEVATNSVLLMHLQGNFKSWFGNSKVIDSLGNPLIVYRGEHSETPEKARLGTFDSRLGSLSFGTARAASHYAMFPNVIFESAQTPRVIPAFLSLQKPLINRPDDPFIELSEIAAAIGEKKARQIAFEQHGHITNTNNWTDNIGKRYASVADFLKADRSAIQRLYLNAYPVLDEPRYVTWFRVAGYDGGIHGGSGETTGEAEYKVFCATQVRSVFAA